MRLKDPRHCTKMAEFEIVDWFKDSIKQSKDYLKEFAKLFEEFKQKNVAIFAVCAEPQDQAERMEKEVALPFKCYSDVTHKLANYLAEEKLLSIVITDSSASEYYKNYTHGVAQPGVLAIDNTGKALYSWAIIPSSMNLGGAKDRPIPSDIWKDVQAKM